MNNDSNDKKEEFLQKVYDVRKGGEKIKEIGQGLVAWGQRAVDLADGTDRVTRYIDPSAGINWGSKTASWGRLSDMQGRFLVDYSDPANEATMSTSSTSAAAVVAEYGNPDYVAQHAFYGKELEARTAAVEFSAIIEEFANKDRLMSLLEAYELDKARPGEKASIELLETAVDNYEKPVSEGFAAAASLLPMRSCCESTINQLIQRRPMQEKAKSQGAKIVSIGEQLRFDSIPSDFFESLAKQWQDILNQLSGSKFANYSRPDCKMYLQKAIFFLLELLQSIDPLKMRALN